MKRKKNRELVFTHIKDMVDKETGEVFGTERSEIFRYNHTNDKFLLVYEDFWDKVPELTKAAVSIYKYLLDTYPIDTDISITRYIREKIMLEYEFSKSSITKGLKQLSGLGLLYSPYKSIYRISPKYVFSGSHKDRNERVRHLVDLQEKNKMKEK